MFSEISLPFDAFQPALCPSTFCCHPGCLERSHCCAIWPSDFYQHLLWLATGIQSHRTIFLVKMHLFHIMQEADIPEFLLFPWLFLFKHLLSSDFRSILVVLNSTLLHLKTINPCPSIESISLAHCFAHLITCVVSLWVFWSATHTNCVQRFIFDVSRPASCIVLTWGKHKPLHLVLQVPVSSPWSVSTHTIPPRGSRH